MRYLVTGGVGFLGTNLCFRLLSENHEVVVVDNLSTSFKRNVELLSAEKNFELVEHDIVDPLPDLGKFDFIYNLACPASPPRYQKEPVHTFRTSVWGIWNVMRYAKETPVFQASTSEVYGNPLEHPQKEAYHGNVNIVGPRSCYDEGKRAAETIMMDLHRKTGHPIKIARIFNTYGPYMDPEDGRVVSNFITQALADKPITVYGDGKQTRSFCFVDDLIDGFLAVERSDRDFTGPVNLGNPKEFSLLELAETIESTTGKKLEREFLELPKDDPLQRSPDITIAKSLGWKPKINLEEGIKRSLDYFRTLV